MVTICHHVKKAERLVKCCAINRTDSERNSAFNMMGIGMLLVQEQLNWCLLHDFSYLGMNMNFSGVPHLDFV